VKFRPGPDPDFPYYDEHHRYAFPDPDAIDDSIIAVGGNLSPGMLLSAYEQGIFPWYNPEDPILWQSPDPRCVIFPETLHVSRSMQKVFKQRKFRVTINGDFDGVIRGCSQADRPGQGGTWITGDIIAGYTELRRLGYVISAESRLREDAADGNAADGPGELAGGCYGVLLGQGWGKVFCGESMFQKAANASKAAFLSLARYLFDNGVAFIDCQVPTDHLISLGGVVLSRTEFLKLLRETLKT